MRNALLFLVFAIGHITSQAAGLTVNVNASVVNGSDTDFIAAGNQVWVGYFQDPAWVQDHRGNLADLLAAVVSGMWQQFGMTTIGTQVAPQPGNLANDVLGPDLGFTGKSIYVWAFETESHAAPTQQNTLRYGLYYNTTDPDWKFTGEPLNYTAIDSTDDGVIPLWGQVTSNGSLLLVPEPAHYALAIGLGLMLFTAGRRSFRRK